MTFLNYNSCYLPWASLVQYIYTETKIELKLDFFIGDEIYLTTANKSYHYSILTGILKVNGHEIL
jgi:hypothetical protein